MSSGDSSTPCLGDSYVFVQKDIIQPWTYGSIASGIIYGIICLLFASYLRLLRMQYRKLGLVTRQAWMMLGYATLTFTLCTVFMGDALHKTVRLLDFPVCDKDMQSLWGGLSHGDTGVPSILIPGGAGVGGNVCFLITAWLADALLLWRCLCMYNAFGWRKWFIVALPIGFQLASLVLGIVFIAVLSFEEDTYYGAILYYEYATFLQNILLTILIISRLLLFRHRAQKILGPEYGRDYFNIVTMLTESQVLTLVSNLIMIAFTVPGSNKSLAMFQILAQFEALAPLLVLHRVAEGKTLPQHVSEQISELRFNRDPLSTMHTVQSRHSNPPRSANSSMPQERETLV